MKNNGRKAWVLLLVLLVGAIIGGIIWLLLLKVFPANWNVEIPIGISPTTFNLSLVDLTFGIKLHINPGSAAGLIVALVFYFWKR